jgi:hypothetical protein
MSADSNIKDLRYLRFMLIVFLLFLTVCCHAASIPNQNRCVFCLLWKERLDLDAKLPVGAELRTALFCGCLHELDDRLLRLPSFHDGSGSVWAYAWANISESKNSAPIIRFINVRFIETFAFAVFRRCVWFSARDSSIGCAGSMSWLVMIAFHNRSQL